MSIKTSISASTRKPGTFAEFDITSGARGLVPTTRRVACVGARVGSPAWITLTAYTVGAWVLANGNLYRATVAGTTGASAPTHSTGTAADGTVTWLYVQAAPNGAVGVAYPMFTPGDGDTFFGRGSELALMVRACFKAASKRGKSPQIWAIALADAGGATKATRTLTVTGPATAAGDVILKICGRTVRAGVTSGDTATTIAAAMKAAIDSFVGDLPYTPSAAAGVVTLTANNAGPNGNDATALVDSVPPGVTVTSAAGVSGSGAYDVTATVDLLVDKQYHAIALANHAATDVSDAKAHADDRALPGVKQFSMVYLAETGTLTTATTLAAPSNHMGVVIVSAEGFPNLPGEIAAQVATTFEAENASYNFDNAELDLFLPPAASVPVNTEVETAIAAGLTILGVNDTQDQATVIRACTTKVTANGAAYDNLLDVSNVRSMFETAYQVDVAVKRALKAAKRDADTAKLLRTVALGTLRSLEQDGTLHNVEDHKGELAVEADPTVTTRFNIAIPMPVVPDLHQVAEVYTLFVE